MRMTKQKQRGYLAPEIEVNEVMVEQGFAGSNLENIQPEKPEQGW